MDAASQGEEQQGARAPLGRGPGTSLSEALVRGLPAEDVDEDLVFKTEDVPLPLGFPVPDSVPQLRPESCPKLGKDKSKDEMPYGRWKKAMLNVLYAAGLGFTLEFTFNRSGSPTEQAYYTQSASMASKGLIHAVKSQPWAPMAYQFLLKKSSTRLLWILIREKYLQKNPYTTIALASELNSLAPKPHETMDQFLTRAEDLRDLYADNDLELSDAALVHQVMTKLHYSWWAPAGVGNGDLNSLSFAEMVINLKVEQAAREGAPALPAEYATEPLGRAGAEKKKKAADSMAHSAQGKGKEEKEGRRAPRNLVCYNCKQVGHAWTKCPTLPGTDWKPTDADVDVAVSLKKKLDGKDSSGKGSKGGKGGKGAAFVAKARASQAAPPGEEDYPAGGWIVDSGATHHMTPHDHLLSDIGPSPISAVEVADGRDLPVEGMGTLATHGLGGKVTLQEVLWVPTLGHSLLSVNSVAKQGGKVDLGPEGVRIYSDKGTLHLQGPKSSSGWTVQLQQEKAEGVQEDGRALAAAGRTPAEKASYSVWHKRLGHLGWAQLKRAFREGLVTGVEASGPPPREQHCEDCVAGKMSQAPFFRIGLPRTTAPLELLHMDLFGPVDTQSIRSRAKYALAILDDLTRYCWVYFLQRKSDAADCVKACVAFVERQYGHQVKSLRSDRGGEFTCEPLQDWMVEKGMRQQLAIAYSPQQNGAAERLNRTLLDRARTMLQGAGLTTGFWEDATRYAAWISNRVPSSATDGGMSPYQRLNNRPPNLMMARTFGSMAQVWVNSKKPKSRGKFAPRAAWGAFLGPSTKSKGWEFYLPESREHGFLSRSAKFWEDLPYLEWMRRRGISYVPAPLQLEDEEGNPIPFTGDYEDDQPPAGVAPGPSPTEQELPGEEHPLDPGSQRAPESPAPQSGEPRVVEEQELGAPVGADQEDPPGDGGAPAEGNPPGDGGSPVEGGASEDGPVEPGTGTETSDESLIEAGPRGFRHQADLASQGQGLPQENQAPPPPRRSARLAALPSRQTRTFGRSHALQATSMGGKALAVQNRLGIEEPASLAQADKSPYHAEWRDAASTEFNRLVEMGTWELVDPPPGAHILMS